MRASLLLFSCIFLFTQNTNATEPGNAEIVSHPPLLHTKKPVDLVRHFSEKLSVAIRETDNFLYIERYVLNPYEIFLDAEQFCRTVYGGRFVKSGALRIKYGESKGDDLVKLAQKYGVKDYMEYKYFSLGVVENGRTLLPQGRLFLEELSKLIGYQHLAISDRTFNQDTYYIANYVWGKSWEHGTASNKFNHSCMLRNELKFAIALAVLVSREGYFKRYYLGVSKSQIIEDFYTREIQHAVNLGKERMNDFERFEYVSDDSSSLISSIIYIGSGKTKNPKHIKIKMKSSSDIPIPLSPIYMTGPLKVDGKLYGGKLYGKWPFSSFGSCDLLHDNHTLLLNPGGECRFSVHYIEFPNVDLFTAPSIELKILGEFYTLKRMLYKDTLTKKSLDNTRKYFEKYKLKTNTPQ
ncbi:MAG: hypothetical protein JXQ95_06520 [Alteromonas stellipolaris]|uniref:hypothetical protein n=1 Tax=Alteromonas stellipolaris TaxID=233316 RepID=UPI003B8B9C7D